MRGSQIILFTILALVAVHAPDALEVRLHGDRLTLVAWDDALRDVLEGFLHAGVQVKMDPQIHAKVTGVFEDADTEEALKELLEPFGYALVWDVVEGPLGPLPKLSEIHIFRPGEEKMLEPLFDPNANLEITTGPDMAGPLFVEDELLLSVKPSMKIEEFKRLLFQVGGTVIDSVPELGIYRVRLVAGTNVPALVQQLEGHPKIHTVEPNYVFKAPEPVIAGLPVEVANPNVNLPAAAEGALPVAILDSGLASLEGLDDIVVGKFDAMNPERTLADPLGHGTQMALIAAGAVVPDGVTASGEATVPVVAIRAFDDNGHASSFGLGRSIAYALEQESRVMNMSWGSETKSEFLGDAIAYAQSKDMIVVASAGNEPTGKPMYPAAYPGVVSVGALSADGRLWDHSNYGDFVFLAAPGAASFPVGYQGPPGPYAGTSIASAYVSRALAAYMSAHPKSSRREALKALRDALTDAGAEGRDSKYGYGVLDGEAMQRLLEQPQQ
jgi:hypothetical protein